MMVDIVQVDEMTSHLSIACIAGPSAHRQVFPTVAEIRRSASPLETSWKGTIQLVHIFNFRIYVQNSTIISLV
jgi:hypothetical protein